MDKEEILKRSRRENQNHDEREKQIKDQSIIWTYVAMIFAVAVFSFIKEQQGYPIMDLSATLGFSVCVGQLYRFVKGKDKGSLLIAAVALVIAVAATIRFAMGH